MIGQLYFSLSGCIPRSRNLIFVDSQGVYRTGEGDTEQQKEKPTRAVVGMLDDNHVLCEVAVRDGHISDDIWQKEVRCRLSIFNKFRPRLQRIQAAKGIQKQQLVFGGSTRSRVP